MKKILLTLALSGLALSAWAQDSYYAELLSRNNYYGTARSVALGNAMTALGGDLGSVGINPAGSAVNSFGQLTITPAMLFQSAATQWANVPGGEAGSPYNASHAQFNLPNVGGTVVFYSSDDDGAKYMTLGIIVNTTNTYLGYSTGYGSSSTHSFLGDLAAAADGLKSAQMGRNLYAAYCANQIGEFGPQGSCRYAGGNQMVDPTDKYAYVPGTLDQKANYNTYGTKTDVLMNLGFNISDQFYFGVNFGMPSIKYRREDGFSETAQSPIAFPVNFVDENGMHLGVEGEPTTYYKTSSNAYKLNTNAGGIYGKFGFIWLPVEGVRLGAAFQTPSILSITETWQYSAGINYENGTYNGWAKSDTGEFTYNLTTPYIVDAGVAFTFGKIGLLSLDYELTDYSVMRYSDIEQTIFGRDDWADTNERNKLFCGVSHALRAGVEVKPLPMLSLRAGYSLTTDPERYAFDQFDNMVTAETYDSSQIVSGFKYFSNNTQAFSAGVGYSSTGSFFLDAAVRLTKYPTLHYAPYYFGGYDAVDKNGAVIGYESPDLTISRSIFDVLFTFGWRF